MLHCLYINFVETERESQGISNIRIIVGSYLGPYLGGRFALLLLSSINALSPSKKESEMRECKMRDERMAHIQGGGWRLLKRERVCGSLNRSFYLQTLVLGGLISS